MLFLFLLVSISTANLIKDGNFTQTNRGTHLNPWWVQSYHGCYTDSKIGHSMHLGYLEFTTIDDCPTFDAVYQRFNYTGTDLLQVSFDLQILTNSTQHTPNLTVWCDDHTQIYFSTDQNQNWEQTSFIVNTTRREPKELIFKYNDHIGLPGMVHYKIDNVVISPVSDHSIAEDLESDTVIIGILVAIFLFMAAFICYFNYFNRKNLPVQEYNLIDYEL